MKSLIRFVAVIISVFWLYNCNETNQIQPVENVSNPEMRPEVTENQTDGTENPCNIAITNLSSNYNIPCSENDIDVTFHYKLNKWNGTTCTIHKWTYIVTIDNINPQEFINQSERDVTLNDVGLGHHELKVIAFADFNGVCFCWAAFTIVYFDVRKVPPAPLGIDGYVDGNGHPVITWNAVNSCDVNAYEIYLVSSTTQPNPPNAILVATVPSSQLSYTDYGSTGIRRQSPHPYAPPGYVAADFKRYWVRAKNNTALSIDDCGCTPNLGNCICQPTYYVRSNGETTD